MPLDDFEIPGSEDTPTVFYEKSSASLNFVGSSFLLQPSTFYSQWVKWFSDFCKEDNRTLTLVFEFDTIKSGSASAVRDMIFGMAKAQSSRAIIIDWAQSTEPDVKRSGETLLSALQKIREKSGNEGVVEKS